MSAAADERWMQRALELAARATGETNPNPMVGAVLVKNGRVVGEGFHQRAGTPHAEVHALQAAGARARGATMYVTLEPCSHVGRTPACAPQVVAAGVTRLVYAMTDPHPLVDGRGIGLIVAAGIEATGGVLESAALRLNERFVTAVTKKRPFVLLKAALTLDGRIGTSRGESKWITSPAQRRQARALRRLHDAVAVGVGTALADDPLLLPSPRLRRPFTRIVFDSRLRLPANGRLARSAGRRTPVLALCTMDAAPARARKLEAAGVEVVRVPGRATRVDLKRALANLYARGIWSVMVEGGSELLGAFAAARLVDQVALFRAPMLIGGRNAMPAFGGPDLRHLADALRLQPENPLWSRIPGVDPALELWYPGAAVR